MKNINDIIINDIHNSWSNYIHQGSITLHDFIELISDPTYYDLRCEEYCDKYADMLGWDRNPQNVTEAQWLVFDSIVAQAEVLFIQKYQ